MKAQEINFFLQDLTFNAKFRFLEESKDNKELLEVAKNNGLSIPDHDLAIFKCVYAYTDRTNKNGCLLPRDEVEKSLGSLKGKSIDIDHMRKTVIGYWLEAKLQGDTILAYGAIWKDSFPEDYEIVKKLLDEGTCSISFEAYGNRIYTNEEKTTYELREISFAGGAILFKTQPAFTGAGILEMAKKRVLEMASIMVPPNEYIHERGTEMDYDLFAGTQDELEDLIETEEYALPLSPTEVDKIESAKKLTTTERKAIPNEHFAVVKTNKNGTKVRKFPIADENHVRNALARLPQATKSLEKLGVSPATVKSKILKRARELKMTDLLKRHGKGSGGGDTYNNFDGDGGMEKARMYVSDMDHIMRNLREVDCPNCNTGSMLDPTYIDYGGNSMKVGCANCGSEFKVDMTPAVSLTKRGRKIKEMQELTQKSGMSSLAALIDDVEVSSDALNPAIERALTIPDMVGVSSRQDLKDDDFAVVKSVEVAKDVTKKIRVFPIHDLAHINLACKVLSTPRAHELLTKLNISADTVDKVIYRKVITLAMKNQMKKYNVATPLEAIQACAKERIGRILTEAELEKAYSIMALTGTKTNDAQGAPGVSSPGYSIIGMPVGKHSDWNATSIMDVTLSDNDFHRFVEKASGKDDEMEKVAEIQKKLDEANAKLATVETEKATAEATRKADLVKARKTELTEAYVTEAKLTDEDLLDDTKYELAKAKQEIATLKKGGTKTVFSKSTLAKGATTTDSTTEIKVGDPEMETAARKRIDQMAWQSRKLTKGGYTAEQSVEG